MSGNIAEGSQVQLKFSGLKSDDKWGFVTNINW